MRREWATKILKNNIYECFQADPVSGLRCYEVAYGNALQLLMVGQSKRYLGSIIADCIREAYYIKNGLALHDKTAAYFHQLSQYTLLATISIIH